MKYDITGSDVNEADLASKAAAYYPCRTPKGA